MFRRRKEQGQQPGDLPSALLTSGKPAPAFSLKSNLGTEVSLSDYRGSPVILVFYPADFSSVCGDQLALYNEVLPLFEEQGAKVVGISVDGLWCHKAFAEQRNLRFPLLSDFEPKGTVAQAYGAYDAEKGLCHRALFVIDAQGIIQWSHLSPSGVNPGADGILKSLASL